MNKKQKEKMMKKESLKKRNLITNQGAKSRGITLVALVITIVILIILSAVTINTLWGKNGLITQAQTAKLMTKFSTYKEELEIFSTGKKLENLEFTAESLNAGNTTLSYNTKTEEGGNIQTVITSMENIYAEKFEIIKGELLLYAANDLEKSVAEALGIKVSPYLIIDGVLISADINLGLQTSDGKIELPERVTEVGEGAFSGVEGIKEIIIPGTVKVVQKNAFSYNTEVQKVTIKDGVVSIKESAFKGCTSLIEITMPDTIETVGEDAFKDCESLISVRLSNNIEILEDSVFQSCSELTTINMPTNLKEISMNTFGWCYKLDNINIPAGVSSINSTSFTNCNALYNITVDSGNTVYEIEDGIIYNKVESSMIFLPIVSEEETITIKEGIKEIKSNALSVCKNMKVLNLPSSLVYISGDSFNNLKLLEEINVSTSNTHLKESDGYLTNLDGDELIYIVPTKSEINIPESIKKIGIRAIQNRNITKIMIPDTVEELEHYIFYNTQNLRTIEIGKGVTELDPKFKLAYGTLPDDIEVIIDGENPKYKTEGNLIINKLENEVVTYIANVETQTVPEGIEKLGKSAFVYMDATNIILPTTLKEIGEKCFEDSTKLLEINIPNSVEIIGENAFNDCASLEKIVIYKEKNSIEGAPWGAPKADRAVQWLM